MWNRSGQGKGDPRTKRRIWLLPIVIFYTTWIHFLDGFGCKLIILRSIKKGELSVVLFLPIEGAWLARSRAIGTHLSFFSCSCSFRRRVIHVWASPHDFKSWILGLLAVTAISSRKSPLEYVECRHRSSPRPWLYLWNWQGQAQCNKQGVTRQSLSRSPSNNCQIPSGGNCGISLEYDACIRQPRTSYPVVIPVLLIRNEGQREGNASGKGNGEVMGSRPGDGGVDGV